jgi:uncharacterized protein (DUF885 family)
LALSEFYSKLRLPFTKLFAGMKKLLISILAFLVSGIAFAQGITPSDENQRAIQLLDQFYMEYLERHPMSASSMGIKKNYDQWDDISDKAAEAEIKLLEKNVDRLKKEIDYSQLNEQNLLSCQLYEYMVDIEKEGRPFLMHNYPITQLFGLHTEVASFLSSIHAIDSLSDAEAYLKRLKKIPALFHQLIQNSQARASRGIIPPSFVFPKVLADCETILKGFPFDKSKDSCTLFKDFSSKLKNLSLSPAKQAGLLSQCKSALQKDVYQAYQMLINHLKELEKKSDRRDGAWKFPEGEAFYQYVLRKTTTSSITPDQVFVKGEQEVARIHQEMKVIMLQTGFQGTLKEFFTNMKESPQFYFPNDENGKAAYLAKATAIIDSMRSQLDIFFISKPKAPIQVRAVEPYREKTSAFAFYQEPAADGSRPGIYYVSTFDMKSIPTYKMEALAYHEGIPGHHMQIALAQEMKDLPLFRKNGAYQYFMAYVEGWALYTEWLPKQYGFYKDPYSDFGRLSMELLRAVRLVVDAGIHARRWTREQAIQYFLSNTPMSEFEATREVERYIVWPSQATAYKIGMIKIQELRALCQQNLGARFDQRKFHDLILLNGALPLNMLEKTVRQWMEKQ